jgi:hypothetical protein
MAKNKNASAEATTNFFSKHTTPSPNKNNDKSTEQQTDQPAIKNWTCSGHKGGPINLNAVANASNIIQAHVYATGNKCGDRYYHLSHVILAQDADSPSISIVKSNLN